MIEILFHAQREAIGIMPDIICKSFGIKECHFIQTNFRESVLALKEYQILIYQVTNSNKSDVFSSLNFMTNNSVFLYGDESLFQDEEESLKDYSFQLAGIISSTASPTNFLSQINNTFRYLQMKQKLVELAQAGNDLSKLTQSSEEQLEKLQEIHQKIVPLRVSDLKTIKLYSKFAAGTFPGGEFFDQSMVDSDLYVVVVSTGSYIVTSYFLTHMALLKSDHGEDGVKNYLDQIQSELNAIGIKDDDSSFVFLKIDTKTLDVDGYNFGGHQLYINSSLHVEENAYPVSWNFSDKAKFNFKLNRKDKLAIASRGLKLNAESNRINLDELMKSNKQNEPNNGNETDQDNKHFFNEVFYQLKKNQSSKFLKYDATLVLIEVPTNAIFSV